MPEHQFIPKTWKSWIATNLLNGGNPSKLVQILIKNGFPKDLAEIEVRTANSHPYLEAGRGYARRTKKAEWFLHNQRVLELEESELIQRREAMSPEAFHSEYYARNRPVIITGLIERWGAFARWNPQYFIETVGDRIIEIQANRNSDPRFEVDAKNHRKTTAFPDFVRSVFEAEETNDFYMTANNTTRNNEALTELWNDIDELPEYLKGFGQGRFFWMGPRGTVTPLHHDLTNNFMAQIIGRKRILIVSPGHFPWVYNDFHCYSSVDPSNIDLERFPLFKDTKIHEIVLSPGELLFLPVGWWHFVQGLDATVTLTFTNFRWPNRFTEFYKSYKSI